MIPVSANPWDDFKQFEKLGSAPKISDITKIEKLDRPLKISDLNSISLTSNNLNDPFRNTLVQPTSSFSTSRINPFDTMITKSNLIQEIPSTSLYESYLDDQMRQMRYTTDIQTSNQIMTGMDNNADLVIAIEPMKTVLDASNPLQLVEGPRPIKNLITPTYYVNIDNSPFATETFILDAIEPTKTLSKAYSLSSDQFKYIGKSSQIMSPPAVTKYEITQHGPYGVLGGQAIGKELIETDHFTKLTTDEFYSTRINSIERPNSLGDITKMNSIDHFYNQKVTYNDFALPYSPGVTVSGSRLESSAFYTPLQPGIGGWANSRLTTMYPTTGYDPTTDWGTRNIQQNLKYTININPGVNNINRINSIPQVPSGIRKF